MWDWEVAETRREGGLRCDEDREGGIRWEGLREGVNIEELGLRE